MISLTVLIIRSVARFNTPGGLPAFSLDPPLDMGVTSLNVFKNQVNVELVPGVELPTICFLLLSPIISAITFISTLICR